MKQTADILAKRVIAQQRSATYVELTKPRITAMVLLTVAFGFALAPMQVGGPLALLHVLFGAALSCSGAGALNQYLERDTDRSMARTRFRPLPSHRVSALTVLAFGFLLSTSGVAWLWVTTNTLTAAVNALTLVTYLFVYTPLKRVSSLSTLAGAIPGALPPVMGWTAAAGEIGYEAWVLFGVLFLWQIPHFLAIGRIYRDDYDAGGFPMLVVVDDTGKDTGQQMVLYAAALIPVSVLPSVTGAAGSLYLWAATAFGLVYLSASVHAARCADTRSARQLLLTSVLYLPAVFGALFLDRYFS